MDKHSSPLETAYALLERSIMMHNGQPVGTVAACDPEVVAPNYEECFVRDFVPSAIVFLLDGKYDIVCNFLVAVLNLRHQQKVMAGHQRAPGLLPASFKQLNDGTLKADFGDLAIGRVAPVDSAMWWMILLRAYVIASNDHELVQRDDFQEGIRLILDLYLKESFETSPAMLVPDASFMIDRRMGVYGHPLEIQALFYGMLQAAQDLLLPNDLNARYIDIVTKRKHSLCSYVRIYYWLDIPRLNEIHRLKTEEFGEDVSNVLNIHPEIIPDWMDGWLGLDSGYLVGNLGPSRMDFRFFSLGNFLSILLGLATDAQSTRIMNVVDSHWDELVGEMPMKIVYPAEVGERWAWVTGRDPKNVPWSYHNGGNWPAIIWPFVASAIITGRTDLAERAMATALQRLPVDNWPEYYDGRKGSLIGRRANFFQTWSATSVIIAHRLLENPDALLAFQQLFSPVPDKIDVG